MVAAAYEGGWQLPCCLGAPAALQTEHITCIVNAEHAAGVVPPGWDGCVIATFWAKLIREVSKGWQKAGLMGWATGPQVKCFRQELPGNTCVGLRHCPSQSLMAAKAEANSAFLPGEEGAGGCRSLQDGNLRPGGAHSNPTAEEAPTRTWFPEVDAGPTGPAGGSRAFPLPAVWAEGSGCPNCLCGLDRPEAEKPQGKASPGPPGALHVSYNSPQHPTYFVKATKSRN